MSHKKGVPPSTKKQPNIFRVNFLQGKQIVHSVEVTARQATVAKENAWTQLASMLGENPQSLKSKLSLQFA